MEILLSFINENLDIRHYDFCAWIVFIFQLQLAVSPWNV